MQSSVNDTYKADRKNARWLLISLLPAALVFLFLSAYPVLNLLRLSLYLVQWQNGSAIFQFVGLDNFRHLFSGDEIYWAGVRNTILFSLVVVAFQMALGFAMAFAVSRGGSRGRHILTGIFLLPIIVPPIVIGTMWRLILGREFGLLNGLMTSLGLPQMDWLGDPHLAFLSIVIVDIWHWTPFVFLLMLTGLESLDGEVLEAARLDVKGFGQELRFVLVPMLLPTIVITALFRIILSFKVFDEIYLLTGGGPGTATEVVNFSIYQVFLKQDRVGDGAAMSVVTVVAIVIMLLIAMALIRFMNRSRNARGVQKDGEAGMESLALHSASTTAGT